MIEFRHHELHHAKTQIVHNIATIKHSRHSSIELSHIRWRLWVFSCLCLCHRSHPKSVSFCHILLNMFCRFSSTMLSTSRHIFASSISLIRSCQFLTANPYARRGKPAYTERKDRKFSGTFYREYVSTRLMEVQLTFSIQTRAKPLRSKVLHQQFAWLCFPNPLWNLES